MDIYGCRIKTLPPLKAMIQLILHHYKEMNSIYHLAGHNCINYNMFKDVYYLWKNNQEAVSLDKLYATSLEYEIIPYVFCVLYFTNWIFQDDDLKKYVKAFEFLTYVVLIKRRFMCLDCKYKFTEPVTIQRENKSISNKVEQKVLIDLKQYNLS